MISVTLGPHGDDENNPYSKLLLNHPTIEWKSWSIKDAIRSDIFHLMWPELMTTEGSYLYRTSIMLKTLKVLAYRNDKNKPNIITVHNIDPHKQNFITTKWLKLVYDYIDGFCILSSSHIQAIRDRYPILNNAPYCYTPHGHYRSEYPNPSIRKEIDKHIVSFIGSGQDYKGLHKLNDLIPKKPSSTFVIAGKDVSDYVDSHSNTIIIDDFITKQNVANILYHSDVSVFPFKHVTNSGSIFLPLGYKTPIVIPSYISAFQQLKERCPDWVNLYNRPLQPENLDVSQPSTNPLTNLGWETSRKNLVQFYKRLIE